jgi:hypothetical protein
MEGKIESGEILPENIHQEERHIISDFFYQTVPKHNLDIAGVDKVEREIDKRHDIISNLLIKHKDFPAIKILKTSIISDKKEIEVIDIAIQVKQKIIEVKEKIVEVSQEIKEDILKKLEEEDIPKEEVCKKLEEVSRAEIEQLQEETAAAVVEEAIVEDDFDFDSDDNDNNNDIEAPSPPGGPSFDPAPQAAEPVVASKTNGHNQELNQFYKKMSIPSKEQHQIPSTENKNEKSDPSVKESVNVSDQENKNDNDFNPIRRPQ